MSDDDDDDDIDDFEELKEVNFIDFSRFNMGNNVKTSIETALILSNGQPINAFQALKAILIVNLKQSSSVYSKFSEFVPFLISDKYPGKGDRVIKLNEIPFNRPMTKSYFFAEPFFRHKQEIMDCDYITIALLAKEDPSLKKFAEEANSTVEKIQDKWFQYVSYFELNRSRTSWIEWWNDAGVPIPEERPTAAKNISKKQGSAKGTYLLTWDPKRISSKNLMAQIQKIKQESEVFFNWSVGRTDVPMGSRVFLMRHGLDKPGLIGTGQTVEKVHEAPHWDETKSKDIRLYYANIRWEILKEFPLIPLDILIEKTGENELWTKYGSGFTIPPEIAEKIELAWQEALSQEKKNIQTIAASTENIELLPLSEIDSTQTNNINQFTISSENIQQHNQHAIESKSILNINSNLTPNIPVKKIIPQAFVETDSIPDIDLKNIKTIKNDSLDVSKQADIFATLLISEDIKPPFSLGLLGDWGVGKSFFMRLMQDKISTFCGKDIRVAPISGCVSRVSQIEFNAWHYVDSDLWASLASHIFNKLSEELSGPKDDVEKIRRDLRSQINSSEREKKEANATILIAQEVRQDACKELFNKEAVRNIKLAEYDKIYLTSVWNAIIEIKNSPENPNWPNILKLKEEVLKTAQQLGITNAINSVADVQRTYSSFRDILHRGSGLTRILDCTVTGLRTWSAWGLLFILIVFIIICPLLLKQIENLIHIFEGSLTKLLSPILQLFSITGSAALLVRKHMTSISSTMSKLEQIQDEARNPRIKLNPTKEEIELKNEIEKLNTQIATEQRRIDEADRRIAEAQAEINRINSGGLVYDFLEGKVHDSRYIDRLGLISVIRQDFEKLGTLLKDWEKNKNGDNEKENLSTNDTWKLKPIERIILYIDDLDRCPPKRVVEVLQAVHLLLAFDLFVVVVAVDSRWLERSLNEAYNPVSLKQDSILHEKHVHRFNSNNYLEKIFQIPFFLPSMGKSGYRKLINKMIAAPEEQIRQHENMTIEPTHNANTNVVENVKEETAGLIAEPEKQSVTISKNKEMIVNDTINKTKESEPTIQIEIENRINAMLLEVWEEKYIDELFVFIRTPRLAKRFINIYRLIRASANFLEKDFSTFIDSINGNYRAVLLLLAINIGYPDIVPEILQNIVKAKDNSFLKWLNELLKKYKLEREFLQKERNTSADIFHSQKREECLAGIIAVLEKILMRIDEVKAGLIENTNLTFDDRFEVYAKWADVVGRYSFHWNHNTEE